MCFSKGSYLPKNREDFLVRDLEVQPNAGGVVTRRARAIPMQMLPALIIP